MPRLYLPATRALALVNGYPGVYECRHHAWSFASTATVADARPPRSDEIFTEVDAALAHSGEAHLVMMMSTQADSLGEDVDMDAEIVSAHPTAQAAERAVAALTELKGVWAERRDCAVPEWFGRRHGPTLPDGYPWPGGVMDQVRFETRTVALRPAPELEDCAEMEPG